VNQPGASPSKQQSSAESAFDKLTIPTLVYRSTFGGVLMGLANLVPGISGGTMLLAAGIYPWFIGAIAEITRFRFRFRSLLLLGCVVGAGGLAILLLAGVVKNLVVDYRWVMYSLFIGLTLGGVPVVWKMSKPASKSLVVAAVIAFLGMVGLAVLQAYGWVGSGRGSFFMFLFAGLAGASAMILPGISGGYLLLLLGQYVPVLSGIDQFKEALKARDLAAAIDPAVSVLMPVAVGVVAGVALVGNLLQWLLQRYRQATLGALLGLLIGSTVGLYPFQVAIAPQVGDVIKGQTVTAESVTEIDKDDWLTEYFPPTASQVGGALLLIGIGFGLTVGISRIGGEES
jgi:putative membrane protein